jgi:hypothetical protein
MPVPTQAFYDTTLSYITTATTSITSGHIFTASSATNCVIYGVGGSYIPFRIPTEIPTPSATETEERWQRQDEVQRRQLEADERARGLLLSYLDDEQRRTFQTNNFFEVISQFGRRYRIWTTGWVGNVDRLRADGTIEARYCAHVPAHECTMHDQFIAQMIMLQYDESAFLQVANVPHIIQRGPTVVQEMAVAA